MKAGCIWCGMDANGAPSEAKESRSGLFYIHPKCFHELSETSGDINHILKILSGEKDEDVISFIKRMERFQRRANGTMRILHKRGLILWEEGRP